MSTSDRPPCTGERTGCTHVAEHHIVSLGDVFDLCDHCLKTLDAQCLVDVGKTFVELLRWQEQRRSGPN